jgi:hypothetical protein
MEKVGFSVPLPFTVSKWEAMPLAGKEKEGETVKVM